MYDKVGGVQLRLIFGCPIRITRTTLAHSYFWDEAIILETFIYVVIALCDEAEAQGRISVKENVGMEMMKSFFGSFLGASSDFMGRATNSMLYRAGEDVGEDFSHLSPEGLTAAFENIGMTLEIQQSGIQWIFIVEDSLENGICGRSYEPCCHLLRGFFSVYARARVANPGMRCVETDCASSGSDFCKFIVSP